jgi:hypothetical protein
MFGFTLYVLGGWPTALTLPLGKISRPVAEILPIDATTRADP